MRTIYTLLTANGPRYAAFHSECDYFITPACIDIKHAASAFAWTVQFARENAANHILDMRPAALERMEHCVMRLEEGLSLSDADAFVASQMCDFLHATVAPHQRDFRFLSDELLERWVTELGVRSSRMADWDTYTVLHDGALYPAVFWPCRKLRYPDIGDEICELREDLTPGQNMLAGRYLRSLAHIARLIGPDKLEPEDIVAAWQGKNREHALSRPSLLSRVFELLTEMPNTFLPFTET